MESVQLERGKILKFLISNLFINLIKHEKSIYDDGTVHRTIRNASTDLPRRGGQ